jgi:GNAT superfamily N-acetyltransferase
MVVLTRLRIVTDDSRQKVTTMVIPAEPVPSRARSPRHGIELRRAGVEDLQAIIDLYEGLTPESRYTRFFMPTPRLTAALRATLTDLERSLVWLAFDGDRCVGEARITTSRSQQCAELAVTVADSHQGLGIGQELGDAVVRDHVRKGGCASFTILPTNHAAARLARRRDVPLRFDGDHLAGRIVPRAS